MIVKYVITLYYLGIFYFKKIKKIQSTKINIYLNKFVIKSNIQDILLIMKEMNLQIFSEIIILFPKTVQNKVISINNLASFKDIL